MAFDVIITSFRMNARESASQVLERIFGTEPERARALVRAFPATVIEGTTRAHAEIAAEQLREAGAKVEITERVPVAIAAPLPAAPLPAAPSAAEQWAAASNEAAWPAARPVESKNLAQPAPAAVANAAPAPGIVQSAAKTMEVASNAAKAAAKTEALGSDVLERLAAAAKQLQAKAQAPVHAVVPQDGATSAAQVIQPVSAAEAAAPRKMFSTVAMQNIEADLQRFEVTDFGPPPAPTPERNNWADSLPPGAPEAVKKAEMPSQPSFKLKAGKPDMPDVDELFAPPPPKSMQQATSPHSMKAKGDELDDLFSPPGADTYFKGKAELSNQGRNPGGQKDVSARPLSPRGEDKGWRPPADKSLDQGTLDAGAGDVAKTAGKATLKTILTKAAAGVVALATVAGTGLAVINARAERAVDKVAAANTPEGKAQAVLAETKKRIHPVIRLAPAALAPAFAGILRKQVDKVFHVSIDWDDAPKDVDCMLVVQDKKGTARLTKLMRTGEKLEYPPDVAGQFAEHMETMRAARGKPNEKYEAVCMSVAFLDDSPDKSKELAKVSNNLDDDDDNDDDDADDKGAAAIGPPAEHQTEF